MSKHLISYLMASFDINGILFIGVFFTKTLIKEETLSFRKHSKFI